MTKALILHANGKVRYTDVGDLNAPQGLAIMQSLVGGNLQFLPVEPGVFAYMNEDGKSTAGLLYNENATQILPLFRGDYVMGDVVLLGYGPDGAEGDVPEEFVTALKARVEVEV